MTISLIMEVVNIVISKLATYLFLGAVQILKKTILIMALISYCTCNLQEKSLYLWYAFACCLVFMH